MVGTYLNKLMVATSCLANALLGGKRYEMLSSRSYRCKWAIERPIDWVFGKGHCKRCFEFERDAFDGIQD